MIVNISGVLKSLKTGQYIGNMTDMADDEFVSEFIWRKTEMKRGDVFKDLFGTSRFMIYTGEGSHARKVFLRQRQNETWYKQTLPAANIRSKLMKHIGWLNLDQLLSNEVRRLNAIY